MSRKRIRGQTASIRVVAPLPSRRGGAAAPGCNCGVKALQSGGAAPGCGGGVDGEPHARGAGETLAAADEQHYLILADLIAAGEVTPFLGAGANLCDRPAETGWEPGRFLPSGWELAQTLAGKSHYPAHDTADLLRISQYVDA